ncbi:hypothetical protein D9M73_82580 [compost metagenome]
MASATHGPTHHAGLHHGITQAIHEVFHGQVLLEADAGDQVSSSLSQVGDDLARDFPDACAQQHLAGRALGHVRSAFVEQRPHCTSHLVEAGELLAHGFKDAFGHCAGQGHRWVQALIPGLLIFLASCHDRHRGDDTSRAEHGCQRGGLSQRRTCALGHVFQVWNGALRTEPLHRAAGAHAGLKFRGPAGSSITKA